MRISDTPEYAECLAAVEAVIYRPLVSATLDVWQRWQTELMWLSYRLPVSEPLPGPFKGLDAALQAAKSLLGRGNTKSLLVLEQVQGNGSGQRVAEVTAKDMAAWRRGVRSTSQLPPAKAGRLVKHRC